MYEWYLSILDDEYPEHMELARALWSPIQQTLTPTTTDGMTNVESAILYHHPLRSRFVNTKGLSKWDRIGKPFIEEMVTFNRRLHFWNPIGKIIGALELHMQQNPDWDDLSTY